MAISLILIVTHACQPFGQQNESRTASPWDDFRPLVALQEGPTYHLLDGYDSIWLSYVEQGVERARSYWGTYGPTHVWIVGSEDGAEVPAEARRKFLEEYCTWRTESSPRTKTECLLHAEKRFFEPIQRNEAEAYLSGIRDTQDPKAELIFINVHKWFHQNDPVPDPVLRGIHEYTHVFQQSVGMLPTWMLEGGAVFAEAWLPHLDGTRNLQQAMRHAMESVRRVKNPCLSIADMEEIETATDEAKTFYRELAYDSGAWATAFMIHESQTKSVASLRDQFYPMVKSLGWEKALARYLNIDSTTAFYQSFAEFMNHPISDQMQMLNRLKP